MQTGFQDRIKLPACTAAWIKKNIATIVEINVLNCDISVFLKDSVALFFGLWMMC